MSIPIYAIELVKSGVVFVAERSFDRRRLIANWDEPLDAGMQGWFSRGFLPHCDAGLIPQFITFRLFDSMPRDLLEQWRFELSKLPPDQARSSWATRIEEHLDKGTGVAWLSDPKIAELVESALLFFDGSRYTIHAWVIMPNHVHVLATFERGVHLSEVVHSWKSYSASRANRLLNRNGPFWQREYFDQFIRNEKHFSNVFQYIEQNPVKAGLCIEPSDWRYGSARRNKGQL